jgi:predicted AAA+ superfamily ATPase
VKTHEPRKNLRDDKPVGHEPHVRQAGFHHCVIKRFQIIFRLQYPNHHDNVEHDPQIIINMGIVMVRRTIQEAIEQSLFKGKAIIIYGARQVGKTTLIMAIQNAAAVPSLFLNCDEPDVRRALSDKTSTELKMLIGNNKLVLIDEAQRVGTIGLTIKLLTDTAPDIQVIATGSSAFELSSRIEEPLTGRKREFRLYPFSLTELGQKYSPLELNRIVERCMIFGLYPEIINAPEASETALREIARSYLYKDILTFQQIRNPEALERLVQSVALQTGNEVSYNELAQQVGVDKKTIESYLRILEQSFVIFRLGSFSRNLRNELKKSRKIYFVDTGIRNAVINNLNPPELRNDVGGLWENFVIAERMKRNHNQQLFPNTYFWRSHQKQEIDYLEERNGELKGYEIKWREKRMKVPTGFSAAYPDCPVSLINRENVMAFASG